MKSLLAWSTRTLALLAGCLSAYLTWLGATTSTAIGCDFTAFDCDAALASPWAKWFGIPVAAGGLLCYGAAFVGSWLAGRGGKSGQLGWRLLALACPLALGSGAWFTFIQLTELESFCLYCVITHGCGVLMTVAAVAWFFTTTSGDSEVPPAIGFSEAPMPYSEPNGPAGIGIPAAIGTVGVVALILGQTLAPSPTVVATDDAKLDVDVTLDGGGLTGDTSQAIEQATTEAVTTAKPIVESADSLERSNRYPRLAGGSREVKLLRGKVTIDAYDHAVLGSPEAPHLVVELMDYACPHCREFHHTLAEAVERFDGEIGVVIMPIPGELLCNKYVEKARKKSAGACYAAKLSMAVSQLAPEHFEAFHEWMLEAETIPRRTASLIEARRHVDNEQLSRRLRDNDGRLDRQIKQYVELAAAIGRNNRFGLPAQIIGDRFIAGTPKTLDDLCKAWADSFGIDVPTKEIPF